MGEYVGDLVLEAIIAFLLMILYLGWYYVWFVNKYNAKDLIEDHKKFYKYCNQVKLGEVTPSEKMKEFLEQNKSRYNGLGIEALIVCSTMYVYGIVVAIFLVCITPYLYAKLTIIGAVIGCIVMIVFSVGFMHNDSFKFLFDIEPKVDDYNNLLIDFLTIYYKE
jgi:hypothetical protein